MAGLPQGATLKNAAAQKRAEETRRWRNRLLCKGCLWIFLVLASYQVLWTWYLAGVNIPDYEINMDTKRMRVRRRPDKLKKFDPVSGKDVPTSPLDGIMEGFLTLVDIYPPSGGLKSSPTQKYRNVKARFCHINWQAQQADPSRVPMFNDLVKASSLCPATSYTVDLWDVARKAVDYDHRNHTFAATTPKQGQGPVPPTAVVFHETRCGSTLIANLFASFMPKHVRVYSESNPPVTALRACEGLEKGACDPGAIEALIRDVFYMMGRITREETPQYVFYKIQSVGTRSLDAFSRAMPQTPWIFSYRDSIEIIMSHFKNYQKGNPLSEDFFPVCLRTYGRGIKAQHPLLLELVKQHNNTFDALTKEEYCAAHLASLAEAALRQHEASKSSGTQHWFVNYNTLPFYLWEKILERVIGGHIEQDMVDKMKRISHSYSKARNKDTRTWQEDSTLKQKKAPEVVRNAAAMFLDPLYERMEAIRQSQDEL